MLTNSSPVVNVSSGGAIPFRANPVYIPSTATVGGYAHGLGLRPLREPLSSQKKRHRKTRRRNRQ
jgi:hypothetical protein